MREHRRCAPGPIGKEVSQGELLKGRIFDIADDKLDDHTVVLGAIRIEGNSTQIGENGETSPVGPQFASLAKQVPSISCDANELTARTAKTIATYASANPIRRNNSRLFVALKRVRPPRICYLETTPTIAGIADELPSSSPINLLEQFTSCGARNANCHESSTRPRKHTTDPRSFSAQGT